MLRKTPRMKIALARSLFLLGIVGGTGPEQEGRLANQEALDLYDEYVVHDLGGDRADGRELTLDDFDDLVMD